MSNYVAATKMHTAFNALLSFWIMVALLSRAASRTFGVQKENDWTIQSWEFHVTLQVCLFLKTISHLNFSYFSIASIDFGLQWIYG